MTDPDLHCPPEPAWPPPPPDPVPADLDPYVVRGLELRRGFEGPQVIAAWESPPEPELVSEIRVVRRFLAFPETPADGKLLFAGAPDAGRLADLELPACTCTYYTVFSQRADTGEWVTLPRARGSIVPVQTGYFPARLLSLLPEVYIIADKKLEKGGTGKLALEHLQDPATSEYFNLTEDGLTPRGQLARFLKLAGGELDLVRGLIDCLPRQFDVDETCARHLPLIARLLGLELNRELSIPAQREEIKRTVEVYKLKGTAAGIAAKARSITGFPVEVDDWCDNVLIANRIDRTSATFPTQGGNEIGLPGDPTSYVIDASAFNFYSWGRFGVFIQIPCGECLPRWVVEKLARALPEFTPACSVGRVIFLDCRYEETYDRDRLGEQYETTITTGPDTENLFDLCWLYSNDEERLTNSRFRTAYTGIACSDAWRDVIHIDDVTYTDDARQLRWLIANDEHRRSNSSFRSATRVDYSADAFRDLVSGADVLEFVAATARWLIANEDSARANGMRLTAFMTPSAEISWDSVEAQSP